MFSGWTDLRIGREKNGLRTALAILKRGNIPMIVVDESMGLKKHRVRRALVHKRTGNRWLKGNRKSTDDCGYGKYWLIG